MNAFVSEVLNLKPRVAAFDCDGTLWSGDVGESFFEWEVGKNGFLPAGLADKIKARYREYRAGKVDETTMCGEMVTMHVGMEDAKLREAAEAFFPHIAANIFPEMRDLIERLHDAGCDIWAVSSSNKWVIDAGMRHFGIPANRVLAAEVKITNGVATDRLIRVPSGPGKPQALKEMAGEHLDAAFGNSRWDTEMLEHAAHAFAVNPNPDLRKLADQRGWTIYVPDGVAVKL